MTSETSPLFGSWKDDEYFPTRVVVRDMKEDINIMPSGSTKSEFNPRPIYSLGGSVNGSARMPQPSSSASSACSNASSTNNSHSGDGGGIPAHGTINSNANIITNRKHRMKAPSIGAGWVDYVANSWKPSFALRPPLPHPGTDPHAHDIGTYMLPRQVALKVEPKVYFANERTLLSWLEIITMLTVSSGYILVNSREEDVPSRIFGVVIFPVSIAFLFYSLWNCKSFCHNSSFCFECPLVGRCASSYPHNIPTYLLIQT